MMSTHGHAVPTRFSILQGVLRITAAQIPAEIVAGITLAAIAVPEVMGYTKISGTPVITGLYTMNDAPTPPADPSGVSPVNPQAIPEVHCILKLKARSQ